MAEDRPPPQSGSDGDSQVAKYLADFLKSSFVYPENNVRVVEPRDALVSAAKNYPSGIRVSVETEHVVVQGTKVEYASANLLWLKTAFERSVLLGATIAHDITKESLVAFAMRLRENFQRNQKSPVFAALWPKPIPGVELTERRFTGVFGSKVETEAVREERAEGVFADGAQGRVLLELLESTTGVQTAIERITSALRERETAGSETRTMRLLETVVRQMPVETLVDPKRAVATVEQVLAAAARRLSEGEDTLTNDESMIRNLVQDVGRKVFGSSFVSASKPTAVPEAKSSMPRGRAGDDEIAEDEEAFLAELHELQELPEDFHYDGSTGLRAEQMQILLYLIGEISDPNAVPRLRSMLARQVEDIDEDSLGLLRAHLEPCFLKFASAQNKKQATRLLELLREVGRSDLLLRTGALSIEEVESGFPATFMTFLDALPSTPEEAAKLLGEACTAIGLPRLLSAQNVLLSSGLATPQRLDRILAVPRVELLPLIAILVRRADVKLHELLVAYVRKVHPEVREAAGLYAIEAAEDLSASYLDALIQYVVTGRIPPGLSEQARDLLIGFVRNAADKPQLQERRIYAIRRLREFPDPKVTSLLEALVADRGVFGFQAEAKKAVRQAAKETLAQVGKRS